MKTKYDLILPLFTGRNTKSPYLVGDYIVAMNNYRIVRVNKKATRMPYVPKNIYDLFPRNINTNIVFTEEQLYKMICSGKCRIAGYNVDPEQLSYVYEACFEIIGAKEIRCYYASPEIVGFNCLLADFMIYLQED